MANASAKRLAAANTQALNTLHLISLAVFVSTFALSYYLGRPLTRYIVLSVPALITEYFLEANSRPKYRDGNLTSPGSDLSQKGLTEYMQDIIYVTWICATLSVIIGGIAWYLYLVVPAFALYKSWELLKAGSSIITGGPNAAARLSEKNPSPAAPELSKRQEKLQKRHERRQNTN